MRLKINNSAPDFSGVDQKNQIHGLKDYQGKWLLLYFYPKDFTSGCTAEACSMRDNFGELRKKISVIGVSSDSADSHAKFADKYQLPFTLLSDPDKKIIKDYGADGLIFAKRVSFLINPEGKIAKIYDKVNPEAHARQILADLNDLGV